MCTVAAAPGVAGVRVWQVMSRDGTQARGTRRSRMLVLAILSIRQKAESLRGRSLARRRGASS
jgi:hypothetical protein